MSENIWYQDLATPSALVDLPVLRRNSRSMAERACRLGVRLRPHVKTHRCVPAARLQVQASSGPVTVSTLAEARHLADAGFRDITYAVPIAPGRIAAAAELARRVDHLQLLVDHPRTVSLLEAHAELHEMCLEVWLKVDCGGRRSGLAPDDPQATALAGRLHRSRFLELRGLLTHAGQAYGCRNREEIRQVAQQERQVVTQLRDRLGQSGIPALETSIGSTPTLRVAEELPGITEVRPGNYVFFDAFQVALGCCTLADVAFSVLATVIGSYPQRSEIVIDAGALALSKDPGPTHIDPDCGFGVVLSADGSRLGGLRVVSLSQEHAVIRCRDAAQAASLAPGSMLRVIPNHSCLAAACFATYHVLDGGRIIDQWHPVRGWSAW